MMSQNASTQPGDRSLRRFVDAQAPVYDQARAELAAGRKRTHWMWFVFPQLKGLGRSGMATHYGLADAAEAAAYLADATLGPRLVDCTRLVLAVHGQSALQILGSPDDLKFRSCMTLFEVTATAEPVGSVFAEALERFFEGRRDDRTLALLREGHVG